MSRLDGFCDKDFLEQILLLDTLCSEAPVEELSGLQQFFEQPTGDTAIDSMVVNALNGILAAHPDSAIAGLHSEKDGFRTLCIRVIGESRLIDGVPALMERITQASLPDEQLDILSALARIKDPQSLPVFQQFLENDDDLIAAMSIETCGRFGDEASIPFLLKIIRQGEAEGQFEQCDIRTWKAIRALGSIGSDEAMFSLTQVLHHKNPTARRIITDTMIEAGEKSVPFLLHTFAEDNTDQRILVANLLGFIKAKTGADGLVEAYDRGLAADPNVRYALYEALGRIGTMKGLICLMDGLAETNDLILMAVIGGLEQQMNPGLVQGVAKTLKQGD
ncbi:MAG: HEAT repeat domain-containing protein, partial [Proteobacteria bacterium]|nr:HEAT repeat domain-containing protein [Pseudomonadota bacterium]MBU1610947.1 HEAT repeat domain-containing protein [Pseudomonadota bacterium]